MMDLVLHAGLPKTATTTIQRHLLSGTPGYLGRDGPNPGPSARPREVDELRALATMHDALPAAEVARRTAAWVERIEALGAAMGCHSVRVSDEGLVGWPVDGLSRWRRAFRESPIRLDDPRRRDGSIPLARYIDTYLHPAWRHLGRIRVCLTLRNQAEWLTSRYAQRATSIWSASQREFEAQVATILDTDDPALNWYTIVRDIADVVGEDNILVLLYEDISREMFWREFARFMGCDDETIDRSARGQTARENKRSDDAGYVWTIRPRSKRRLLYTHLKETCSGVDPGLLRRLALPMVRVIEPAVLRPILDRKRESRIRLTPALRQRVRDHFAPSNERLGDWLGRDLHELGY